MAAPPDPRAPRWVAVAVLVALVASACSGGEKENTFSGPARRATGEPIVVGFINQENSPVGSFPEVRQGAEAAARYVSDELGGVGNRPIQLEVCTTTGSPESSQACANELVGKKPVAVIGGVDLGAASSLPVLRKAGIPYIGGSPTLAAELTSSAAFMLSGGTPADLLGQAEYILGTLKPKKVAILYVDLAGVLSVVPRVASDILKKKGVTSVKLVSERADAADFTPAVTAASAGKPDVIVVVFPAQGCSRIMQAKQALGVKAKMFYPSACAEQSVVDAAGAGADGAYFAAGYLPYSDPDDDNVAVYRAELGEVDGAKPGLLSETGFSVVMDLASLLGEVEAPLTAAKLTEEIRETDDRSSFLGHSYTCDGRQVLLLTSVCNAHVRILQHTKGRFRDVVGDWVTGTKLLDLITG